MGTGLDHGGSQESGVQTDGQGHGIGQSQGLVSAQFTQQKLDILNSMPSFIQSLAGDQELLVRVHRPPPVHLVQPHRGRAERGRGGHGRRGLGRRPHRPRQAGQGAHRLGREGRRQGQRDVDGARHAQRADPLLRRVRGVGGDGAAGGVHHGFGHWVRKR